MAIDELQLMRGRGIKVGDFLIKPLSIGEIEELTESKYFQYISMLGITKESFQIDDESVSLFDLVFVVCTKEEDFRILFLKSMSHFLREEVSMYIDDDYFFYTENEEECKIINETNFESIIEVVKLQNCLTKKTDEDEDNPADEKTRQILERQKRARALLAKAKKGDDDGEPLTLSDLVSILSSNGNGVTPFNVWDMNFYWFNNQFNRMKMLDEYDINIRSLLAGAKAEDIDLKHWMGKIK